MQWATIVIIGELIDVAKDIAEIDTKVRPNTTEAHKKEVVEDLTETAGE